MTNFFTSLSILNSIALVGLLSLIIPILIHLFNPNKGKTVLIGNLDFINKHVLVSVTEMRISQWLLLIVRLLILLFLTLILADLTRNHRPILSEDTNVFVSIDWLTNSTIKDRADFIKQHDLDNVFLIEKGFPELASKSIYEFSTTTHTNKSFQDKILSIDSFIAEIQNLRLFSKKNIIYATTNTRQYSKEQPTILNPDYFQWRIKNIEPAKASSDQINIDVYASPSRVIDSQYLTTALETLSKNSDLNFSIRILSPKDIVNTTNNKSSNVQSISWIFWLSSDPIPSKLENKVSNGSYLIADSQGSKKNTNTNKGNIININGATIHFYSKLPDKSSPHLIPLWQNKNGQTALSYQTVSSGRIYQFNSRFHPDWTNLVNTINFPFSLSALFEDHSEIVKHRQISQSELESYMLDKQALLDRGVNQSYRSILILFLCLFWLLERFISERSRSTNG